MRGQGAQGAVVGRALRALCGLALALWASGGAADGHDRQDIFAGCVGSLVEGLAAIRTEFPEFWSNEVRVMLSVARALEEDDAESLGSLGLTRRALNSLRVKSCTFANAVGGVGPRLRNGSEMAAEGRLSDIWRMFEASLLQ